MRPATRAWVNVRLARQLLDAGERVEFVVMYDSPMMFSPDFRVVDSRRAYLRIPHRLDVDDPDALIGWLLGAIAPPEQTAAA